MELVLAHPLGIVEVSEGTLAEQGGVRVIELASVTMALTSTGDRVTGLRRRLEVSGDAMTYELHMQMESVPLAQHLRAELHRV